MKNSLNINNIVIWSLVGIQIVLFMCLYAMEKRVSLIESTHYEPKSKSK